ncbi:MAG: short chain dehydrogenase [Cellulophaga sp.]|uniref:short chain dehydrogenase n=1 Tax=unclassified Cellulophaga TaxID=2634405 RepID=UPI000C2C883B|nr:MULTISPECIES: short chain dehydrogenase [unclassified Cellulophaga]MDO6490869.1 short chain dehydrogenase [Cellulophaga sp. 2_MG-2023]MDO6493937.1 short chain dehydrogenase [Cellulophaga sp. 3_MG-2023]PKB44054.1 NAD(P)-dependent dehydrogenase (short-subunit alcohol dehydrogenase family) [Cellulophaga sp. RHA19]
MKTIILIGANGKMGQAALTGLKKHKIITAGRSAGNYDYQVDITSETSLRKLYTDVGHFDAVVNTVGVCEYANFTEMTEEQWMSTILSKMMGQINIVRIGQEYIADKGSFTLITGILNVKPIPFAIADATTSGAIDTFVKCVAFEMPRGIRVNSINPTVLEEAWDVYGEMMPGFEPVPGRLVGKAFERSVDGFITGQVLYVDAY